MVSYRTCPFVVGRPNHRPVAQPSIDHAVLLISRERALGHGGRPFSKRCETPSKVVVKWIFEWFILLLVNHEMVNDGPLDKWMCRCDWMLLNG